jgi:hypothetical protein
LDSTWVSSMLLSLCLVALPLPFWLDRTHHQQSAVVAAHPLGLAVLRLAFKAVGDTEDDIVPGDEHRITFGAQARAFAGDAAARRQDRQMAARPQRARPRAVGGMFLDVRSGTSK